MIRSSLVHCYRILFNWFMEITERIQILMKNKGLITKIRFSFKFAYSNTIYSSNSYRVFQLYEKCLTKPSHT